MSTTSVRPVGYDDLARAVERHGFVLRGLFRDDDDRTGVIVGNVSGAIWPHFEAERRDEPDPLDAWTRRCLEPIAAQFGAEFVHPSDTPFRPFQRWAQQADTVWQSPIGLLIHPEYGLWHAYRGALVFPATATVLTDPASPAAPDAQNPCLACADQPCLNTCPVGAFTVDGYDAHACRQHVSTGGNVAGGSQHDCLHQGCAARCACPVGAELRYGPAQMLFHMRAFAPPDAPN